MIRNSPVLGLGLLALPLLLGLRRSALSLTRMYN